MSSMLHGLNWPLNANKNQIFPAMNRMLMIHSTQKGTQRNMVYECRMYPITLTEND